MSALASRSLCCSFRSLTPTVFVSIIPGHLILPLAHVLRLSELTKIFLFFLIYFTVIDLAASVAVSPSISMD